APDSPLHSGVPAAVAGAGAALVAGAGELNNVRMSKFWANAGIAQTAAAKTAMLKTTGRNSCHGRPIGLLMLRIGLTEDGFKVAASLTVGSFLTVGSLSREFGL